MGVKDMIDFAEKHLRANDMEMEELKVWMDEKNAMAIKTGRSEIINVLKNYVEMEIGAYNKSLNITKSTTTVKSTFGIKYIKDILKLMTKVEKNAETITIELGDNTAVILRLNDANSVVLEIELAPILEWKETT